jgi:Ca2+-binding RTX toxin-like protein
MATFSWKSTAGMNWNTWWDLSGLQEAVDPAPPVPKTSTHFVLVNVAEDVRFEFNGTDFSGYSTDSGPTSGTCTRVRVYEQGSPTADVNGLSISAAAFTGFVETNNVSGFLNTIFGGADTINGNVGADILYGRNGNDIINGGAGADRLFGEAGNDSLRGGAAGDRLTGGGGVDTLVGGAGIDTLIGGPGADRFVLNTAGAGNRDNIGDFTHGVDKIQIDNAVFTGIGANGALAGGRFWTGANAHDANDRIIYNANTGALFYDADGNGAGAKVQIALLSLGDMLTAADIAII